MSNEPPTAHLFEAIGDAHRVIHDRPSPHGSSDMMDTVGEGYVSACNGPLNRLKASSQSLR
jgi:hypothetical protein